MRGRDFGVFDLTNSGGSHDVDGNLRDKRVSICKYRRNFRVVRCECCSRVVGKGEFVTNRPYLASDLTAMSQSGENDKEYQEHLEFFQKSRGVLVRVVIRAEQTRGSTNIAFELTGNVA